MCLGVAQLVARDVWDVEVAGSSPVTQTIFVIRVKSRRCGIFRASLVHYFIQKLVGRRGRDRNRSRGSRRY